MRLLKSLAHAAGARSLGPDLSSAERSLPVWCLRATWRQPHGRRFSRKWLSWPVRAA